MPVYRTYLPSRTARASGAAPWPPPVPGTPDAITSLAPTVLLDPANPTAIRFQQLTGAVMAKGVEDTAFYRWTRFVALNEVGGAPERFGVAPDEFHAAATDRQRYWPTSMTTLSTHDTKRGEDVRARLAVLSEVGPTWREAYAGCHGAAPLDDPEFESLLWQTAVGAWPIERDRLHAYAEKAAREASTSTSWDAPVRRLRARGCMTSSTPMYDDEELRAVLDAFVATITPPRLEQRARPETRAADHARRTGRLPGHRTLGQLAGRPGQPARRSTSSTAPICSARWTAAGCRRSRRAVPPNCS